MVIRTVTTLVDENDEFLGQGTGDSLREIIAVANPGDEIGFSVTGTIVLKNGELIINKDLTINGDTDSDNTTRNITIDAGGSSRIFRIDDNDENSNQTVKINGLIITGGVTSESDDLGGGILSRENLMLENSTLSRNSASNGGGGIASLGGTDGELYGNNLLQLSNSIISGNTSPQSTIGYGRNNSGSGIFFQGNIQVDNSIIRENIGNGSLYGSRGVIQISESTISSGDNNEIGVSGGFLGEIYISESTINSSIYRFGLGGTTISHSVMEGDIETYYGGSVLVEDSTFTNGEILLRGSSSSGTILDSEVTDASIFTLVYSDISITNSTLTRTRAFAENYSSIKLNSSTLIEGGAETYKGELTISNTTIQGGGVSNNLGTTHLKNSTISGGIVGIYNHGNLTVRNSTIVDNQVAGVENREASIFADRFGFRLLYGTVDLASSIISGNGENNNDLFIISSPDYYIQNREGVGFFSSGNNLIGNADGAEVGRFIDGENGDLVGTADNPLDPMLGPLQNNGGPTATHAVLEGSPAINAGSNLPGLETDQRGEPRVQQGVPDIGAFESDLLSIEPSEDDDITGTAGADTIDALVGDDTVRGRAGDDQLLGSGGNDRLLGQAGDDLIMGGIDNDTVDGGIGDDTLQGGDDNDILDGSSGHDLLDGEAGNDRLRGGNGSDSLVGGAGNDILRGGNGRDTLVGVDATQQNPGQGERDVLQGHGESDRFVLGDETSVFYNSNGFNDRATIQDFRLGDIIQLSNSSSYRLVKQNNATRIFENKGGFTELIAIVQDITGLDLSDPDQFHFV